MTGSRPEAADAPTEELALRAARGDLAAFARIVRLNHEDMTRVGLVIAGDIDAAIAATDATWPVAWDGMGRKRVPEDLRSWLCSLAAGEATFAAMLVSHAWAAPPASGDTPGDGDVVRALGRLAPRDRALLALHHVAGLSVADLSRLNRRSRPPIAVRLERLTVEVGGLQSPGSDPATIERRVSEGLLAYASAPIRPVDADLAARRARAGAAPDLARVVSVVISVVIGGLVAGLPYLAMFLHGR